MVACPSQVPLLNQNSTEHRKVAEATAPSIAQALPGALSEWEPLIVPISRLVTRSADIWLAPGSGTPVQPPSALPACQSAAGTLLVEASVDRSHTATRPARCRTVVRGLSSTSTPTAAGSHAAGKVAVAAAEVLKPPVGVPKMTRTVGSLMIRLFRRSRSGLTGSSTSNQ